MRLSALPSFAAVLMLAACGTSSSEGAPDAGSTAPDAGSGSPDAGSTATGPGFDDTYALFAVRCGGCHSPQTLNGDLDLSTREMAYASLVGKTAQGSMCSHTPHTLVIPGNSAGSLLYQKLAGTADCGLRMPQGPEVGPSRPKPFTAEELAIVSAWIDGGARD